MLNLIGVPERSGSEPGPGVLIRWTDPPHSVHVLLQVRATDNGTPPRYTDHSLTINILDVNDNAPVVESPRGYNVSVSEVGSQAFDLLTFRSWLPGVRQPMVVTQRFVFSTFEECWKRDVGSPCGGY